VAINKEENRANNPHQIMESQLEGSSQRSHRPNPAQYSPSAAVLSGAPSGYTVAAAYGPDTGVIPEATVVYT
jgi:hypothetical protein